MATDGYTGKIGWVNLSSKNVWIEKPAPEIYSKFLGGYGLGVYYLFKHMLPGVDPLGPENILGFLTGPLTGSPAPTGSRFMVVCKSPLTGTWGDSNAGGYFGPYLKFSGFDALFIQGRSSEPIYILVKSGRIDIHDAKGLWGHDTYETESRLKAAHGAEAQVACIGPAGENLSRIASIIHLEGRAAGRSGVGAVMGSKNLKAMVVTGNQKLSLADPDRAAELRKKYIKQIKSGVGRGPHYSQTGTPGYIVPGIIQNDSPTQNWVGMGHKDFVQAADTLDFDSLLAFRDKKASCWRCPIGCWGTVQLNYQGRELRCHQPEYQTAAAFGSNCLNDDLKTIIAANDLCNRLGLDTISTGSTIAFAMECYEKGLLKTFEKGICALNWGNPIAIIEVIEAMAHRRGWGLIFADGVKIASEKIGPKSRDLAMHVRGQELPMHDPRFEPAIGLLYKVDATPARHTQASQFIPPPGFHIDTPPFGRDPRIQRGKGKALKDLSSFGHAMNCSGICLFGYLSTSHEFTGEFLEAVTGIEYKTDDLLLLGERISNLRHLFNLREGINLAKEAIPNRSIGIPPLPEGPTKGLTVDIQGLVDEYYHEMEWELETGRPSDRKMEELGLKEF